MIAVVFGLFEGKIIVTLEKTAFVPGETINGKIKLDLSHPKKARELRVEFYGEQEVTTRDAKGQTSRKTNHVFSALQRIDGEREYKPGEEFEFSLVIPQFSRVDMGLSGVLATMTTASVSHPFGGTGIRGYYVHASLDVPNAFDVNDRVKVTVNPNAV